MIKRWFLRAAIAILEWNGRRSLDWMNKSFKAGVSVDDPAMLGFRKSYMDCKQLALKLKDKL